MRRVLRLLETLNSTNSGSTIYQHIELSLQEMEAARLENEALYVDLLELLLDALTGHVGTESPLQTQIHILRASLMAPMQSHELLQIKEQSRRLLSQILYQQDTSAMARAFDPLLSPSSQPPREKAPASPWLNREIASIAPFPQKAGVAQSIAADQPFQESRSNIQRIKARLNEQINLATEHNNTLARLIMESMESLQQIDSKQGLDRARSTQLRRYNQLIKEHQDLTTKFSAIQQQLEQVESESQQLDEELTRVHLLSVTDELTQLPNRRALMQRLEDEVTRVQRYGSPLALAIIDLDEFKPINDTFGHNAGDAVLRYFAETALTVFRHHDTVARYGGEEFAVLMPNTELEGALCALRKIQNETGGSLCRVENGIEISVPTFSAGVALYNPGETPEELIKRADTAMYRAKRSGRNRIEVHTMGMKQKISTPQ